MITWEAVDRYVDLLYICSSGNCIGEKCSRFRDGDICRQGLIGDNALLIESFIKSMIEIEKKLDEKRKKEEAYETLLD